MDYFARIKAGAPLDTEELRYDFCEQIVEGTSYIGLALAGTATSELTWTIVKIRYDGKGDRSREQLFTQVSWDNRRTL